MSSKVYKQAMALGKDKLEFKIFLAQYGAAKNVTRHT